MRSRILPDYRSLKPLRVGARSCLSRTVEERSSRGAKESRLRFGRLGSAVLCLGAIVARHEVDQIAEASWVIALIAALLGYRQVMHRRPPEDLSRQIFPHES